MSDVREVSEWHEAMEGSLTVAGERLSDAMADLINATGMPAAMVRVVDSLAKATVAVQYMATHARLSLTPEYQELKRAADAEEQGSPDAWFRTEPARAPRRDAHAADRRNAPSGHAVIISRKCARWFC